MGQQQLLLLVLATVIVGLATVAGIQAFDENRNQAAADALSQKAATLAADVKGIYEKPQQLGGLDSKADWSSSSPDASSIKNKLGMQDSVEVPAAEAACAVSNVGRNNSHNAVSIVCVPSGEYSSLNDVYGVFEADGDPEVFVDASGTDPLN